MWKIEDISAGGNKLDKNKIYSRHIEETWAILKRMFDRKNKISQEKPLGKYERRAHKVKPKQPQWSWMSPTKNQSLSRIPKDL